MGSQRMNIWLGIAAVMALLLVAMVAAFVLIGPERIWNLFGPSDLGAISFETLKRRSTPNDALACPPDVCSANSDLLPPAFALSAMDLRLAFRKVIASEDRVVLVEATDQDMSERYIQRSRLMGFPDTIVVRFLERPGGQSTLALYSRSQLGEGDLGVNRARIERWLEKLTMQAPIAK
jgi:uncharacterized protein (DUF1499 family)